MTQIKPEPTETKLENEEAQPQSQPQLWAQGVPEVKTETEEIKVEPPSEVKEEDEQGLPQSPMFGTIPSVYSGVNLNGDKWCTHDLGRTVYHYVNKNGSIYYQNPDRSSYYWDPRGYSRYTTPDGKQFLITNPNLEAELDRLCFRCAGEGCFC